MKKIKDTFSYIKNFKYFSAILLTVIIAVQIISIINVYFEQKTSYHCDEIYSYGLSNSFYRPYIECDSVNSPSEYNINEWFSAEEFRDYLTVQNGQRFRYDSVWYNQSMDRHPPLYYSCLHTICSFFPDSFSFLYGFILNLVLFAVMQIFMYKFGKNLFRSRYAALMMCLVYGYSSFVLKMTLFIRMYLMVTMFMVMLLYYHSRLIKLDRTDIKKWKLFLPVFLVTLAGALTQYLFLFGAFVLAVCFCLRYLFQKRFRMFFIYGLTMLSGVLLSFAIYPAALGELFGEVNGAEAKFFDKQVTISIRHLLSGNYGWTTTKMVLWITIISSVLFFAFILSLPLIYLFRDKPKVADMLKSLRSVPHNIKSSGIKGIIKKIKSCNPMPVIVFLMIVVLTLVSSYSVNYMIGFAERYLFIMAPMVCATLFSLVFFLFRKLPLRKVILSMFSATMIFTMSKYYLPSYIMSFSNDINVQEETKNKDVLILGIDSAHKYEFISLYSYELYNADHVFCSSYDSYKSHLDEILSEDHNSEFYVLMSYSNHNKDEKGEYISVSTIGDNAQQYRVYIDEVMGHFSSKGRCEFVGKYEFTLGSFLIYKFEK